MPKDYAYFKVTIRTEGPLTREAAAEILAALANAVRNDAVHPPLTTFMWTLGALPGQPAPVRVSVET
jgi:hypothetical protein